ncbi:MAG: 1-acyl-sn-glycerol-3-phosphate acyltransferase [Chloroflexota bacterium]|nr:1-acyl-sn-glycerol-3-phosphate acyltransferase [Chloroflexota bacterium]
MGTIAPTLVKRSFQMVFSELVKNKIYKKAAESLSHRTVRILVNSFLIAEVYGSENLDGINSETIIMAANHFSRSDILALHFADQEVRKNNLRIWAHPTIDSFPFSYFLHRLFEGINVIYTHGQQGAVAEKPNTSRLIEESISSLMGGDDIGIFPEGRYNDARAQSNYDYRKPRKAYSGIGRLLKELYRCNPDDKLYVVPVFIDKQPGTLNRILEKFDFCRVNLYIGKPIDNQALFLSIEHMPTSEELTTTIMSGIYQICTD